jgi:hypothetical protein
MEPMSKLKLKVDDLAVESFDAGDGREELRGTVQAHASMLVPGCPDMQTVLPLGACSTRCDGTTVTNDTLIDCTVSCNTDAQCTYATCP